MKELCPWEWKVVLSTRPLKCLPSLEATITGSLSLDDSVRPDKQVLNSRAYNHHTVQNALPTSLALVNSNPDGVSSYRNQVWKWAAQG